MQLLLHVLSREYQKHFVNEDHVDEPGQQMGFFLVDPVPSA
jgi:hypothetical protein